MEISKQRGFWREGGDVKRGCGWGTLKYGIGNRVDRE
jgi:hypothetical protein